MAPTEPNSAPLWRSYITTSTLKDPSLRIDVLKNGVPESIVPQLRHLREKKAKDSQIQKLLKEEDKKRDVDMVNEVAVALEAKEVAREVNQLRREGIAKKKSGRDEKG